MSRRSAGTGRGPEAASAADDAIEQRLAAIEQRLAAVEGVAERAMTLGGSGNHLSKALTGQMAEVRTTLDRLASAADDLEHLAATLCDETALARRLARIEDALLEREPGSRAADS